MLRTLTLRGVPDSVLAALRERARRNHRSMQRELLSVLQGAVVDRASLAEQLRSLRRRVKRPMRLDEIHAGIEEGRP